MGEEHIYLVLLFSQVAEFLPLVFMYIPSDVGIRKTHLSFHRSIKGVLI